MPVGKEGGNALDFALHYLQVVLGSTFSSKRLPQMLRSFTKAIHIRERSS